MRVSVKLMDDHIVLACDVDTMAEAMERIADLGDVFNDECCGVCGSTNTRFQTFNKRDGGGKVYKRVCQESGCGAGLMYGCTNDGKLFPSRKDRDKNPLPDNGWNVYKPSEVGGSDEQSGGAW